MNNLKQPGTTRKRVLWWSRTIIEARSKSRNRQFKSKSNNKLITLMNNNLNMNTFVKFNSVKTNRSSSWLISSRKIRKHCHFRLTMITFTLTSGLMFVISIIRQETSHLTWYGLRYTLQSKVEQVLTYIQGSIYHRKYILVNPPTLSSPKMRNWTSMKHFVNMKGGRSTMEAMTWWMLSTICLTSSDLEAILVQKYIMSWLTKFRISLILLSIYSLRLSDTVCFILEIQLKPSQKVLVSGFAI